MVAAAPHPQPALIPAQIQAQQAQAAQERELAKRRSRKPTDKNIPEGVAEAIIGDGVQRYQALRDVERRLDATMMRKRLDIQDSVNRNVKRYRTLRIWISNTAENQPWQAKGLEDNAFDFSMATGASYKVRIEGRLLDDDDPEDVSDDEEEAGGDKQSAAAAAPSEPQGNAPDQDGDKGADKPVNPAVPRPRKRFSHFFKSITVEFDRSSALPVDASANIEWKKPALPPNVPQLPPSADFDCLEFERKSDENLNCTINLVRDENPERYRLSRELAEVLDTDEDARAGVVLGLWEYIKAMGLQEDEEKRTIRCDDRLKAIFKQDQLFFPHVPDLILNHLSPLPPIKLPYTIRVDAAYQASPTPTVYDVRVPLDDPLRAQMIALTTNPAYPATLRSIASLDDQLALIIQALAHSKAKHGFFTAMAADPAAFVRRWVSSQQRDLQVILGEATRGIGAGAADDAYASDEFRRGGQAGVWGSDGVRESVGLWLARP
ncbi:putative SWI-SNF complex subunit [Xylona heveae TC161]|uniref:Putative SWI-SNF complex subunit n=1 Tax=Xylona heveae (strain CBS 132557 / TC161) TaxID=1328760 RepID=A0A165IR27_XYLHT|nr:putative SWI-SNF complex subunit [Xylona heveae TC161]KZF25261.1 putative SWI-SNF complex subunit [Xylona heveae TC161]